MTPDQRIFSSLGATLYVLTPCALFFATGDRAGIVVLSLAVACVVMDHFLGRPRAAKGQS